MASSKTSQQQQPKKIDIADMDYYTLNSFKKQIESELEILEQSVIDLHNARTKFSGCSESIKSFETLPNGNNIMIPLTTSLYVPGRIINNNEFLIDIGTGYYLEKDRKNSEDYFERKVKFLNSSIDRIVKSIQEKSSIRQICTQRLQQSVMAQLSAANAGNAPGATSTGIGGDGGGNDSDNSPTTTTANEPQPGTSSG